MKFENIPPRDVRQAIREDDAEKLRAMARAGGKATAKKKAEALQKEAAYSDLDREMHEQSMHDAARARNEIGDLTPEDL